jgi:hypothetical protein
MVLFPNDTLTFYTRGTQVISGEGIVTGYGYSLYKAGVRADVQPLGQQPLELLPQGLSDLNANDRMAYVDTDPNLKSPMKAVSAKTGVEYEVLNDSPWNSHFVLYLRPLQGGQVQ